MVVVKRDVITIKSQCLLLTKYALKKFFHRPCSGSSPCATPVLILAELVFFDQSYRTSSRSKTPRCLWLSPPTLHRIQRLVCNILDDHLLDALKGEERVSWDIVGTLPIAFVQTEQNWLETSCCSKVGVAGSATLLFAYAMGSWAALIEFVWHQCMSFVSMTCEFIDSDPCFTSTLQKCRIGVRDRWHSLP